MSLLYIHYISTYSIEDIYLRRQLASCILRCLKYFKHRKITYPHCFMQGVKTLPKSAFLNV
ncbi:hypothetical protein EZS27_018169 [termite gut metagenome]|uniref:Uncharacterized protein n=1 Tax=termite gut metagenome TaxID=433724 RepID=A0A5J4RHD8_9ZZZZ